ncbi:MAG: hypothetical protein V4582_12530 [Pseudomonadota bacterium]
MEPTAPAHAAPFWHRPAASASAFALVLAVLLSALLALVRPTPNGDLVEYSVSTVALAEHGTPALRPADIAIARAMLPQLAPHFTQLELGMRAGLAAPHPGFRRGRDGAVYAIHFFGYSALAALPYRALRLAGVDAPGTLKCFQFVNACALFVLGMALYRLFTSPLKALLALAMFMLCGGAWYWTWASPECLSAAALLAALASMARGRALSGSLLAGLAAQQNPSIVAFFVFAPLLLLCADDRARTHWRTHWRTDGRTRLLQARLPAALGAGLALFALPVLFNLWQFGVPNIIAHLYSDARLIGVVRLVSFYCDLNQGMVVAIPGVLGALLLWRSRSERAMLLACAALTLALALPALSVLNWNSGAAGVMRYAFWAAMPLLFALLWRWRAQARMPWPMLLAVGLTQALATASAASYSYTELSPLARLVLAKAPHWYHPEPEIFAERTAHNDNYIFTDRIYSYEPDGMPILTLYNRAHPDGEAALCGPGGRLTPDNRGAASAGRWRYLDGTPKCSGARWGAMAAVRHDVNAVDARAAVALAAGWGEPEHGSGNWDGVWSNGARSRIMLTLPKGEQPGQLLLEGQYFAGNKRSRVRINGSDLGWQELGNGVPLSLANVPKRAGKLAIELEYDAPYQAPSGTRDQRALAFFLHGVALW